MKNNKIPIGLGTAAIGRPQYINIRHDKTIPFDLDRFRQQGLHVLEEAYRQGIRYFDTAPGYGMAEQLLMDWLKEKDDEQIEIATKWGYTYVANFDPSAKQHEIKEHSLNKLNEQWKVSQVLLPALSTYQIHSATFETGVLENLAVLNRLAALKSNFGLKIGISTSGDNQVDVIRKALEVEVEGIAVFDTFQVTYNLLDQSLGAIASDLSAAGKRIIIKEALANGRVFPNNKYPHYQAMYQTFTALAKQYEVGLDAIALRFCIDKMEPFMVLSGAATPSHISENLKATQFQLAAADLEQLAQFEIPATQYWNERKQLIWN